MIIGVSEWYSAPSAREAGCTRTRIAVTYLGKVVEVAPADDLYDNPLRPYTACRFHTRCPFVQESLCAEEEPVLRPLDGHLVACYFAEDVKAGRIRPRERSATFEPGPQRGPYMPPVGLKAP